MLNKLIGLATAASTALMIVGCSVRHADRPENKGPVDPSAPVVQEDTVTTSELALRDFKLRDAGDLSVNTLSASELLANSLTPLAAILFDPSVYLDRETSHSDKFYLALSQFNVDLLKVQRSDAAALASSNLLEEYKSTLFLDCDIALRGTCKNLKTFGSDASFSKIMQLMAQKPGLDVFEYYRFLKAALERPQANLDQNLSAMFLERSDDLAREYLKQENGTLTEQQRQAMRDLSRYLQNIWANFDPQSVDRSRVDNLMRHFQWNISRKTDAVTAGMDKTLGLAVRQYLYEPGGKTTVTQAFSDQVDAIQNGTDEIFGLGIKTIYDRIENGPSKGIFLNLGLVADQPDAKYFPNDEYMYLIDRIYYGHFSTTDAESFWSLTSKDRRRLLEAANKFVRIQVANRIVWTNDRMNTFFKTEAERYDSLIPLLIAAVNNASLMAATWDNTRDSIVRVDNFVSALYGNVDVDKLPEDHPYGIFHKSMSDLPHNTKMLSVYPNMMMLVYVMAKNNFNAKIRTFWGAEYTITASQVVKSFFIDVMTPWFSFGTDKTALSKIELLYAMHFALQTETFKAFQDIPKITVTDSEFFAEITDKLTQDMRIQLEDVNRAVRAHFETNTKLLRDAQVACAQEKEMAPLEEAMSAKEGKTVILPRTYVRAMPYENMTGMLANGFNGSGSTPLGAMVHLYGPVMKLSNALMQMRTTTDERLLYIENLYQMIDFYLEQTTPAANREAVKQNFKSVYDAHLRGLMQYRELLLARIHRALDEIGDCDTLLFKHEIALKDKLYQMEEEYLNTVYANLKEMKDLTEQGRGAEAEAKIATLNASMVRNENGLPPVYLAKGGLDRYVHAGEAFYYKYYKLDSKLRMRGFLTQIAPATEITLPNFDKLPEYLNQTPTALQLVVPPADTAADQLAAAEQAAKTDFINDGMRLFAQNLSMDKAETPYFMLDKLTLMAQLYRLGPVSRSGAKGCEGDDCLRVSAEDIIRQAITLLKMSDTNEFDQRVLIWKTSEQKHKDDYWDQLAMETGTRRQIGLLDLTLQRVFTDDFDPSTGAPTVNGNVTSYFETKALEYFNTEKAVGNYLFKPRTNVTNAIKQNYKDYVIDYENKVSEFIAAYKRLRKEPDMVITHLRKGRVEMYNIPTETVDGVQLPVYIYQDRMDKYDTLVSNFHEGTKCAFKEGGCN